MPDQKTDSHYMDLLAVSTTMQMLPWHLRFRLLASLVADAMVWGPLESMMRDASEWCREHK